jgi:hypothetical protein
MRLITFLFLSCLLVGVNGANAEVLELNTDTSILLNSIKSVTNVEQTDLVDGFELKIVRAETLVTCAEQMCSKEKLFLLASEDDFEGALLNGYEINDCKKFGKVSASLTTDGGGTIITFKCNSSSQYGYSYLMQGIKITKLK